jgi:multiple antibiotic resistance protein
MKTIVDFLSWVGVALVTLLSIVNPVSTAVLLLSISTHLNDEERNRQITRACMYMTAILIIFLFAGHLIMLAFRISIPGIRIAGGMIIGYIGFQMLFPEKSLLSREGKEEAQQKQDISFSPLAMPSLSGPGSIAVVITMSSSINGQHGINKVLAFSGVVLAIIITAIVSWLVLRGAGVLRRYLGLNGVDALSKVMGFLLICIGIQFMINGVQELVLNMGSLVK